MNPITGDGKVQAVPVDVIATGKNAHAIGADPQNAFVFASNLGSDVILQYRFDAASGKLVPNTPASVASKAGAGPRHFVFHPGGSFVYASNELDGSVSTYSYDHKLGTLTLVAGNTVMLPGFSGGAPATADIHLTPDGRFLYVSERTSSTLSAFRVNPDTGALTGVGSLRPRRSRADSILTPAAGICWR